MLQENKIVIQYSNGPDENPRVSIIVSTYNHDKYIELCINSLLGQKTNFSIEIILGEDDSQDSTRALCKKLAVKYPSIIKLFLHSRSNVIMVNGKQTGRFNFLYGLSQAKGKYIALCDGDDYWTDPYKLQKQVDFLETNPDYSGSSHWVDIIYEDSDKVNKTKFRRKGDITIDEIIKQRWITIQTGSFMFRGEYLNDELLSILLNYKGGSGDSILFAYLTSKGTINSIEEIMSIYRLHRGGITDITGKINTGKEQREFKIYTYKGLILLLQAIKKIHGIEKSGMINKYVLGLKLDIFIARLNLPKGNKLSKVLKKLMGI